MLPLVEDRWSDLSHAYGRASNIPALLERAKTDIRPGHMSGTSWFDLWSALCHQGDIYTASYAAVPHLVAIGEARQNSEHIFEPLFLTGCVELARLEGRGPEMPKALAASYYNAVAHAKALLEECLTLPWPTNYRSGILASIAALSGDRGKARAILDADWEGA